MERLMGHEAKARQERREARAAALAKVLPLDRLAARLDAERARRPKPAPVVETPRAEDGWVFADGQ
jgi:hypothetical protein